MEVDDFGDNAKFIIQDSPQRGSPEQRPGYHPPLCLLPPTLGKVFSTNARLLAPQDLCCSCISVGALQVSAFGGARGP
jgi:hypothetical protein